LRREIKKSERHAKQASLSGQGPGVNLDHKFPKQARRGLQAVLGSSLEPTPPKNPAGRPLVPASGCMTNSARPPKAGQYDVGFPNLVPLGRGATNGDHQNPKNLLPTRTAIRLSRPPLPFPTYLLRTLVQERRARARARARAPAPTRLALILFVPSGPFVLFLIFDFPANKNPTTDPFHPLRSSSSTNLLLLLRQLLCCAFVFLSSFFINYSDPPSFIQHYGFTIPRQRGVFDSPHRRHPRRPPWTAGT
jgi:hypothetical protein